MQLSFSNLEEAALDWETARSQVQTDLRQMASQVNKSWSTEHTKDGGHADITATSVEIQGAGVGEWIDLPSSAGRFFAEGAAVWTVGAGTVNYLKAMRIGQAVWVMFSIVGSTITVDTPDALYIALPEFQAIATSGSTTSLQTWFGGGLEWADIEHSTVGIGNVDAQAQPISTNPRTILSLNRITPTNATFSVWPITNELSVGGFAMFPVNYNNAALPYSFE